MSSSAEPVPTLSPPLHAGRLSRVNSSSGSFSQKSLQSFRTVALPGLFPGTHLGILASGSLDKRRDGAVRGGWAKRLFILSTRSLHYYRKAEESELFGKERGQVPLSDIGFAKYVSSDDAPYGAVEPGVPSFFCAVLSVSAVPFSLASRVILIIVPNAHAQKKNALLLFLRADSLEIATSWVSAINHAQHIAKGVNFAPRWSVDAVQNFVAAASSNFKETIPEELPEEEAECEAQATPKVVVISVASTSDFTPKTTRERLVTRSVELLRDVELGAFHRKDFCILVLSDGDELHIPQHMLGDDLQALLTDEKKIVMTTPPRSRDLRPNIVAVTKVHVSFRCVRDDTWMRATPAVPTKIEPIVPTSTASAFSVAFPCVLCGLYLLSCIVSFSVAMPFEGLMQVTIVLGIVLSISQIAQFAMSAYGSQQRSSVALSSTPKQVAAPTQAPAVNGPSSNLIFYLRVNKIEVIESDQDLETVTTASAESTPMSEEVLDTPKNAISGGPIAFSHRFIDAEKGDEEKGRQRYEATLEWRAENNVDNILVSPHPTFSTIKKFYPQYFHGRTKAGLPVYYEQPGKINLPALKREGLSLDDLLRHYMYITEYLWRVIEPSDTGRSVTVLDVTGIGMSDLGGEVLDFIKRASSFTGAHYPERSAHIFIINIPGWFNMIWRMVKPLIDPVTREKVHMLKGSAILKEMLTLIDEDNVPSDLGGTGPPLGASIEEQELLAHVNKYL